MDNPSDVLPPRPTATFSGQMRRSPDDWGIEVNSPTAYELYFGSSRGESAQRAELEDAFFNELWVRYGTSKTTYHHRLDDLDQLLEPLLPPDRPLELMDVAVSSGISTVEWMQCLARAGIAHRMLAGDAVVDAYLISFGEHLRMLTDRTGFLMQLDVGGRAISARPPRCLGRLRFVPAILAARCILPLLRPPQEGPRRRFGMSCRALKLVTPALLAESCAEVIEDDILHAQHVGRFHVVRAANILNRNYFEVPTLKRMLLNLRARLLPGGLLVVCRTMPGRRNDATIFRLESDGGFAAAAKLNEGSEIADLVLSLNERT